MYSIDKTHAFLLVKALSQRAEYAFGLRKNAGAVVQPVNVEPSSTAPEFALQLTLAEPPVNPTTGYVFGSSEEVCDILLDTVSNKGVSSMAFSIKHKSKTQTLNLNCLAKKGIYFRNTKHAELEKLGQNGQIYLEPGESWIIVLGSIQIVLSTIPRDHLEQRAYDRNLREYLARLDKAELDLGKLNVRDPATSITETPGTRVLTGIWDKYTAAGKVGEGGYGYITACISKTGVTCCVKEAREGINKRQLQQEIRCLRRVAHPSIVKYIDRDEGFTWMAMELVVLGNLEQQQMNQPFRMREIEVLIYQVLDALSHVHSCDILHHDIKTFNILVQIRTENKILVKLADFGSSVRGTDHPDKPVGTPMFWAPECFRKSFVAWGLKIDVWALAMVALRLLFDFPVLPKEPNSMSFGLQNPYAEGWGGSIKAHYTKKKAEYLKASRVSEVFFHTLSRMFDPEPDTRIGALKACKKLREDYPSGYFFSLGTEDIRKGDRTPGMAIIKPVLPANSRSDDESIFRFRELDVEGVEGLLKPLLMLEGCYLVNLRSILRAYYQPNKMDIEVATYNILKSLGHMCWRIKRTGQAPETYIRIENALELCKKKSRLGGLAAVLKKQQALCDEEMAEFAGREGSEDKSPSNEGPSMRQLSLIESIPSSDSIIAITEEGRMLLVRPKDGLIYVPSVQAAVEKRLLSPDDLDDPLAYMPLDGLMLVPGILSHNDIISLGAATYSSF